MRLRNPISAPVHSALHTVFEDRESFPRDLILYMRTKDGLKNQVGNKNPFASSVLGPQYVRAADGSYTNAGAVAPVDVFDGEKWLRTCGAVTNMLTNSVFAGAVSGTPGTAPTGWTNRLTGGSPSTAFDGVSATYIGNGGYITDYYTFSASANTTYLLSADIVFDGAVSVNRALNIANTPTGATVSFWVDDAGVALNAVPAAGLRRAAAKIVIGATAGSPQARIGCGVNAANTTGQVTISNPQLTATAYPLPYVPTTAAGPVTQPASNATTTNGCWFAMADGSPVWNALSGGPMTLATRVRMGVGSEDLPVVVNPFNIVACKDFVADVQHFRVDTTTPSFSGVRSYDGASVAKIDVTSGWPRNAIIRRVTQVNTAGTQFRVGYMIEGTHTTIQWGSWVVFDGSFNPSTLYKLMLGYNNIYPLWFDTIAMWNTQADDATILKWVKP